MNDGVIQGIGGERDDIVDVQRLIKAVRGSQVAQVLYELRPWLLRSVDQSENETGTITLGTSFSDKDQRHVPHIR